MKKQVIEGWIARTSRLLLLFAVGLLACQSNEIVSTHKVTLPGVVPQDGGVGGEDQAIPDVPAEDDVADVPLDEGSEPDVGVFTQNAIVRQLEPGGEIEIVGDLETQAIIDALVAIGGFEADGARRLVAATLGHTSDTLPETVPFRINYGHLE